MFNSAATQRTTTPSSTRPARPGQSECEQAKREQFAGDAPPFDLCFLVRMARARPSAPLGFGSEGFKALLLGFPARALRAIGLDLPSCHQSPSPSPSRRSTSKRRFVAPSCGNSGRRGRPVEEGSQVARHSSCGTLTARPRSRSASVLRRRRTPSGASCSRQRSRRFRLGEQVRVVGPQSASVTGIGEPVH